MELWRTDRAVVVPRSDDDRLHGSSAEPCAGGQWTEARTRQGEEQKKELNTVTKRVGKLL